MITVKTIKPFEYQGTEIPVGTNLSVTAETANGLIKRDLAKKVIAPQEPTKINKGEVS